MNAIAKRKPYPAYRTQEQRLAELKGKIRVGIDASERGEVVDGDAFLDAV
jgi:5-methylcytosine-specific restriction endonuclease McrBC regulatory subunit McrC